MNPSTHPAARPKASTVAPAGVTRSSRGRLDAAADLSRQPLDRVGGYAALLFVVLVLVPVALVFAAPLPPTQGPAVLEYIAAHKAVYLIELVSFVGLAVPALVAFAALTLALTPVNKPLAAVGGLFGIVSETIALALGSSPQSLHGGLVVLSDSYAASGTDAERARLASAAEALIAATNAVSWAGILTAAAILLLSIVIWQAGWGRALAIVGVAAGAIGGGQRGPPPVERARLPGVRPAAADLVRLGRLEAPPCSRVQACPRLLTTNGG